MSDMSTAGDRAPETPAKRPQAAATTEYCAKLQEWMWLYYCGQSWQSLAALSAFPFPQTQQGLDGPAWNSHPHPFSLPAGSSPRPVRSAADARRAQQQDGDPSQAGQEYNIPSPLQRFLAEIVDFFILFCVKATIVLWIMYLSGMKEIAKFITQFIVEDVDESTSMEDLQKMMAVALAYRVCVCAYEIVCIWGAGGATPGKFLLGLQVVKCDTTTLVRPNRVLVVPASNVSLSASAVRALNKNFSIAFLFPVFITVLFFQHNRPVYDIVAGTIVVQRRRAR